MPVGSVLAQPRTESSAAQPGPAPAQASAGDDGMLPLRVGHWSLHVLGEPKQVVLGVNGHPGERREFAVPVYVYLPDGSRTEQRLRELEAIVGRILSGAEESQWRRELERWHAEVQVEAAMRQARPLAGGGDR